MVCRLAASTDPTTSSPALVGQSASAASLRPLPPRRPRVEPSLVATLKRHFRKSGFSGRAARVLSGVLRESSSRLYQSRWRIFCGWCRGSGVAPVNATVPVVVDFLIHLCHDKGLSVSAVKGYCSALNSVLALKGLFCWKWNVVGTFMYMLEDCLKEDVGAYSTVVTEAGCWVVSFTLSDSDQWRWVL